MTTPVLYDNPGPRMQRRVRIGSIVAGVVLLGVVALVLVRLGQAGQLSGEKWGPIVNPYHPQIAALWTGLSGALLNNFIAAVLAMALSLVVGTVLAVTRLTSAPWYRWIVVGAIELFRGLPVVIAIYLAYRILPELGVDVSLLWYLVIGLTAYNSVIIAEIVRSGVLSLPRGQAEAAAAIGLTRVQSLRLIQLPQAFRVMLPALISQLVVILKDTSLGFIILYPESVRFVRIAIQELDNPIQLFFVLAVIFIVINYLLGRFAEWVERRLSRARTGATPAGGAGEPETRALAGTSATGG
ncbi:amino acid ABC transporter permease [Pseudonocardia kunmingensis]|uniref:Amino acid ABC transporter membrane protein 2 (PAAT family) n=1 Tax=Pseudonocardia kunmingensis TaxID=630975 RepID=A0A543DY93_9PSEU|nr:amino acid ABC transporter permease [Pseudonocardia kunmingensis]TQM14312.1 amino acid ABC transporter membrane protein 2 (PAAT family) [Pseudonocardia kunmingensis]